MDNTAPVTAPGSGPPVVPVPVAKAGPVTGTEEPVAKAGSGSAPAPKAAPAQANISTPPSMGTENGPIKVEFQALYDYAYLEIKQCFCKGMADLFSEAMIPASDYVYEAIEKAMYIDVIDPEQGKIMSQINPEYENIIGAQVENIVHYIMNNPDPQVRIDIRKNLAGGCQLTKEIYEAEENVPTTRKMPTAIVGGKKKHKNTSRKLQNKKKL